jgi:hypothetical protein
MAMAKAIGEKRKLNSASAASDKRRENGGIGHLAAAKMKMAWRQ